MIYYYPSCKFTSAHPELSERMKAFLSARGVRVADCCRKTHGLPESGDTALTVCQACSMIVGENRPDCEVFSVFEYLDALSPEELPLPDLGGERITVQDCYRQQGHEKEKAAVRSLLKKMNVDIVELPGLPEEKMFDGGFLYAPISEANMKLAPKAFGRASLDITPLSPAERTARMKEYCRRFKTRRVVCFCNSCLAGLKEGLPEGKSAVHLAELVFAGQNEGSART
ncbi:MAG: hypothetical protein II173_03315 [Firmicutes bacterium]|nr:hypothetical protein [Bacillota bacterium]